MSKELEVIGRRGDTQIVRVRESRAPKAATLATTFQAPGQPIIADVDAESAVRLNYILNVYVYRCVQVISQAIAGSPFRAGKNKEDKGNWRDKAPLAQLLGPSPGAPNENISARRLWQWTVAQYLITGRWGWEIDGSVPKDRLGKGRVDGLYPLPAHLLEPIPSNGGTSYFDGFIFGRRTGKPRKLAAQQVVYDWRPSQLDFRQPESAIQAARLDIQVAIMQDRYDYAFLRNDARPAAVIVHEEFADPKEKEAFKQQFLSDYRGPQNAGKPIFIEASPGDEDIAKTFHVEVLGLSQRDAEFIARYENKIRSICVAFGTPLSILGDSSKRTFTNADQEHRNWWEGTVLPLMAELEDAVNMQLAPRVGNDVGWFDTSHVVALQAQSKVLSLGPALPVFQQAGIITTNEIRSELGLPPIEGGDLVPDAAAAKQLQPSDVLSPENPNTPTAPQAPPPTTDNTAPDKGQGTPPPAKNAQPKTPPPPQKRLTITGEPLVMLLEQRWTNPIKLVLERIGEDVERRMRGRSRRMSKAMKTSNVDEIMEAVMDKEELISELVFAIEPLYRDAMSLFANFDADYISSKTTAMAQNLAVRTYVRLRNAAIEGVEAGDDLGTITERMQVAIIGDADDFARTMAQGEAGFVYDGLLPALRGRISTEDATRAIMSMVAETRDPLSIIRELQPAS